MTVSKLSISQVKQLCLATGEPLITVVLVNNQLLQEMAAILLMLTNFNNDCGIIVSINIIAAIATFDFQTFSPRPHHFFIA